MISLLFFTFDSPNEAMAMPGHLVDLRVQYDRRLVSSLYVILIANIALVKVTCRESSRLWAGDGASRRKRHVRGFSLAKEARTEGNIELTERDAWEATAYAFSTRKKWTTFSVIFTVQMSMNLNTGAYPSVAPPLAAHYHISEQAASVDQIIFLVLYAIGCELWGPYSEEFGRW
jgi:hypothetical protein